MWHLWNCEKRQLLNNPNACKDGLVEPFSNHKGDHHFEYEQKLIVKGEERILKYLPELIEKYKQGRLTSAEETEFNKYHRATKYFQPKTYDIRLDQATIDNLIKTQRINSEFKITKPFALSSREFFNIEVKLKITTIIRDSNHGYIASGNPIAPDYGEFDFLIGGIAYEKANFATPRCDIEQTELARNKCYVTERDAQHVAQYHPHLRDVFFPEHKKYHAKTIAKCYKISLRKYRQRQKQTSESVEITTAKTNILT